MADQSFFEIAFEEAQNLLQTEADGFAAVLQSLAGFDMHSRTEVSNIFVFILSATFSREALTSLERCALPLYFVSRSPATVSFGF